MSSTVFGGNRAITCIRGQQTYFDQILQRVEEFLFINANFTSGGDDAIMIYGVVVTVQQAKQLYVSTSAPGSFARVVNCLHDTEGVVARVVRTLAYEI